MAKTAANNDKGKDKEKSPLSDVKPKELPTYKHTYQKNDPNKIIRNSRSKVR